MLPKINPTQTKAWSLLKNHSEEMKLMHMRRLFEEDPERFSRYSRNSGDILLDFSKNLVDERTLALLFQLAEECRLKDAIEAMFEGDLINETEHRPVLHTALRNFSGEAVYASGKNIMEDIQRVLHQIKDFCHRVHQGEWTGYSGKRIRNIVNIGIGGSDLGPLMVAEALKPYRREGIRAFFVSNIDGSHIHETLKELEPGETLFLVASKTFTTQETMTNARTARAWFLQSAGDEKYIARHFVAISANEQEVVKFGISPENIFEFWDWVGGRYSLWSAIGLAIALTAGFENFEELLRGGGEMDRHFRHSPLKDNLPVLMALIGIWNTNFLGAATEAVLPYDQYLHRFPAYLQQGNMESNGKSVDRNGEAVDYSTGPVIWGEPGTNGQHAFYQLIHQGTQLVPCDFIAPARSHHLLDNHHLILLSNFFAQTRALMQGKTEEEAEQELLDSGKQPEEVARLAPYRIFEGNRPTNSILLPMITPFTLGQLIALYEHKIFAQGVIWNIYSFDQWGVELGKQIAGRILPILESGELTGKFDSSTIGLIQAWKKLKG